MGIYQCLQVKVLHSYHHIHVHVQLDSDILCHWSLLVFSSSKCRYGEIVNINLVRDKKTGKSKGFCFLAYENQQSTVLAVDNFNGIKV